MTREARRALLVLVAMLSLGVAACGAPPLVYPDQAPGVPREALRRLKTQAGQPFKLRRLAYLQVTDAEMTGDTPDHVKGTVVFRTLFGIPFGVSSVSSRDLNWSIPAVTWAVFLLAETVLGIVVLRRLWDMP
ncbi:MAG: hypothetical protein HY689_05505 [Chloroflexi bacterium]|nr:hypothetical protein [Chloroflexota bacterium]